jgi:hypothetical protein
MGWRHWSCYTQIRKCGGALKVAHLDTDHLSLNVLTKLNTVFEVFVGAGKSGLVLTSEFRKRRSYD